MRGWSAPSYPNGNYAPSVLRKGVQRRLAIAQRGKKVTPDCIETPHALAAIAGNDMK